MVPSPMEAYEYDELPQDAFRYLTLLAGVGDDPLKCSLHTSLIEKAQYESVSYVWGTHQRDHDIECDGRVLKITPNLYKVLQRVRLPHDPRHLWADSICINQADLHEKSRQVTIMGQIYRNAERVLICIGGSEGEHGPRVLSLLHDVCEMIEIGVTHIHEEIARWKEDGRWDPDWTLWDLFPHPSAGAPVISDPRWASLNVLLEQDWFKRGWVVREAGLAREGVVLWGKNEISWDALMRTLVWRHRRALTKISLPAEDLFRSHLEAYEAQHQDVICVFYQQSAWQACSLLDYIHFARILRLTDPRDRIYAFLDLTNDSSNRLCVVPKYTDPPSKVYRDFAEQYISTTGDVNLLLYVKHDKDLPMSNVMTWAPDWNTKGDDNMASFVSSAGNYPALTSRYQGVSAPEVVDGHMLRVKGVVTDSVQYVSDVLKQTATTPSVLFELWKRYRTTVTDPPYDASYSFEAFFDGLAMSGFYGDVSEWFRDRRAYIAMFQNVKSQLYASNQPIWDSRETANLSSNLVHNRIAAMTSGKRFIITKRGYIGFAPDITSKGDLCAIVFGCCSPCILRKSGLEARFVFVGSSFVLGKTYTNFSDSGDDRVTFNCCMGVEDSKDWLGWDIEEQDIYLV